MPVNAKTKYKAKKTKIVFFDIDDTLRVKKTGYIPESIKAIIPFHVRLQKPSFHGAKRLGLPGDLQVRISQLFQSVQI